MAAKKKGARSKYDLLDMADRLPEVEQMARNGYTNKDICQALGIAQQTLNNWREKYPDFAEAIKKGKMIVDAEIEQKLITNEKGHLFWEETQELMPVMDEETGRMINEMTTVKRVLKYIKPDTTAQIFWLKNRRPNDWRDRQHLQHEGNINVNDYSYMEDAELDKALKELKVDE